MLNPSETLHPATKKAIEKVSSTAKISHIVSSRYALALLDLAEKEDASDAIAQDLQQILSFLKETPEIIRAIQSPATSRTQQHKIVTLLTGKVRTNQLTSNFLGVLAANRRLPALLAVIDAVQQELAKRRGEMNVEVKTAQDMTKEQLAALQQALSNSLGRTVSIRALVEPSILGGMIVTVGSQMIDDSVARKLQRLQNAMSGKANQNNNENMKAREA